MRISARQIEIFQMAYRQRSTRKAADALFISQPGISRAVAELETEIGVVLFDRSGRKYEPTAAAHSLHEAVHKHYLGLGRVKAAAMDIATGSGGHLRVAALPAVADTLVAIAAGQLMAQYPSLRIDVDVMGEQSGLAALREGRVDCAVISSDPADPNLASSRIADIPPTAIVPLNDPLVGHIEVTPKDLASEPLIMFSANSPFRKAIELMFQNARVAYQIRAEARTQTALVRMVSQSAGRGIVDRTTLRSVMGAQVVAVPLVADLRWPIRIVTPSASHSAPIIQQFTRKLKDIHNAG